MTGASAKGPATKRQVPMTTGSRPASVLGEIGQAYAMVQPVANKVLAQSTGRMGGMKLPAGWGGEASALAESGTQSAAAHIQPQTTGQFRPRSSTMSGASSSSGALGGR